MYIISTCNIKCFRSAATCTFTYRSSSVEEKRHRREETGLEAHHIHANIVLQQAVVADTWQLR